MTISRRHFLKGSMLTGLAAVTPGSILAGGPVASAITRAGAGRAPMRILILGGSGFIGPHMVEYALERGHEVTLFNRGRTNTDLFPEVEKLVGDRSDDLSALEGRRWDVVIDNHATLPRWVRQSAQLLKDAADQYIHVSTISVYDSANFDLPDGGVAPAGSDEEEALRMDEDSPLAQLPDDFDGSETVTGLTYGPFKWMAENEAREAFGERATIVRPGLIVGPRDPTDRFTYWPVRLDRGGRTLAPGTGDDAVQVIDARDLTGWIVRLAENRTFGTFNATGPAGRLSMEAMLSAVQEGVDATSDLVWVPADDLAVAGVNAWSDMPAWLPRNPLLFVRLDRAMAAGLTWRPLSETSRDTLEWFRTLPEDRQSSLRAGIAPAREEEILASLR